MARARTSRRPSELTPTAMMTATEARRLAKDLLAKPADLAFGNAAHAQGLDAIIDQAGRDPLPIGLLDAGGAVRERPGNRSV